MEPQHLLDSNAVIDFLCGVLPVGGMELCAGIGNAVPQLSVVSKIELLRFVTAPADERVLKAFVEASRVLPLNDSVVDETIRLCKKRRIKIPDAVIAATCIVCRLVLVTRNVKDFRHIDGLAVINPWGI